MSPGPILYGALAFLLGAAVLGAREGWLRAAAFCLTLAVGAALWQTSLGRPRAPLFASPAGTVVGYKFDEPHAIYLWMVRPGEHVPTAYALPWSEHRAAQLQQAAEQAKKQGTELQAGGQPHGARGLLASLVTTTRSEYRFYPAQPQPLPPKTAADN